MRINRDSTNMGDNKKRRLSDSSSSDDESPNLEFRNFSSDNGFLQSSSKHQQDDSSQDEGSFFEESFEERGKEGCKSDESGNEETPERPLKKARSSYDDYEKGQWTKEKMGYGSDESPSFEYANPDSTQRSESTQRHLKRQRADSSLDEETFEPPEKKSTLDDKVKRMMENMGYKKGVGLGKHGQGRLEPVEAFKQKGRRGLGHTNEKLTKANLQWDPAKEVISVEEELEWLVNTQKPPTQDVLNKWLGVGPSKETVEDENLYCDGEIVSQVLNSKSVFDNLDNDEMKRARTRSNPFETIRGAFFLNRAAVKMANMDKACNFMFTSPKNLKSDELLYFADVCAGPGGFSEYVLWRKKWRAKGFGFTLKDSNDFKLEDFHAGPPESFHPFYGEKDDGNVYDPKNQLDFRKLIMEQTRGKGVHFMMSDGGFSYTGQENKQEILSKQLYLCQCLVALMIVREGGNYVTKLFDLFTPFSAGLVYIMYRCFRRVSIFKPNTSRPANSERYFICEGKLGNVEDVVNYLFQANRLLLKNDKHEEVMQLVPHEIIEEDHEFFQYLKNSNETLGRRQVIGLLKIAAFCEDTLLTEPRQIEMRKKCLEYWELPDMARTIPRNNMLPQDRLQSIMKSSSMKFIGAPPKSLTSENVQSTIVKTPFDWFCIPCSSNRTSKPEDSATFYMGMGRSKSYRYDRGNWVRVKDLELPADTLVYAESIFEYRGERSSQLKTGALHIIDSYFLGGEDVSQKYIEERYELSKLFAEALLKPDGTVVRDHPWTRIRTKELIPLKNLKEKLILEKRVMKSSSSGPAITIRLLKALACNGDDDRDEQYIVVNSLLFLKGTAQPWQRHLSRNTGFQYYWNSLDNRKFYDADKPSEADASFPETYENRVVWYWPDNSSLTLDHVFELIHHRCGYQ